MKNQGTLYIGIMLIVAGGVLLTLGYKYASVASSFLAVLILLYYNIKIRKMNKQQ